MPSTAGSGNSALLLQMIFVKEPVGYVLVRTQMSGASHCVSVGLDCHWQMLGAPISIAVQHNGEIICAVDSPVDRFAWTPSGLARACTACEINISLFLQASMAAQGEQDFKWLATMDSEAIISTMAQLKAPRDADKNVPVALTTKKRTPRKRTKSVKAAEAEEMEELLDVDSPPPAKKACGEGLATTAALSQPALPNAACGVLEHSPAAGPVPLFKPVSDQPAGATVEQHTDISHVPAADDAMATAMPIEDPPPAVDAIRAPDPVGPSVPTWTAQHVAPVEQLTDEGAVIAPPEAVQVMEHDVQHPEVRFLAAVLCSFSESVHVPFQSLYSSGES